MNSIHLFAALPQSALIVHKKASAIMMTEAFFRWAALAFAGGGYPGKGYSKYSFASALSWP